MSIEKNDNVFDNTLYTASTYEFGQSPCIRDTVVRMLAEEVEVACRTCELPWRRRSSFCNALLFIALKKSSRALNCVAFFLKFILAKPLIMLFRFSRWIVRKPSWDERS